MIFNKPPSVGGNTEGEESNLSYTLSVFKKKAARRPPASPDDKDTHGRMQTRTPEGEDERNQGQRNPTRAGTIMPKGRLRPDRSETKTEPGGFTNDQARANRETRARHREKNKHNIKSICTNEAGICTNEVDLWLLFKLL
jgi:hypothetical protein